MAERPVMRMSPYSVDGIRDGIVGLLGCDPLAGRGPVKERRGLGPWVECPCGLRLR